MHRKITGGFHLSNESYLSYFADREISTDEDELLFQDPKQQAKFKLGVLMALDQWEEFRLAEEHCCGGAISSDKRDSAAEYMMGCFLERSSSQLDDLFYPLESAMSLVFNTYLDNASPYLVGDLIFQMYEECSVQDYSRIDDMFSRFQEKQLAGQFKRSVVIEQDSHDHVKDEDGSDWSLLREIGTNRGTYSTLVIVEYDSD